MTIQFFETRMGREFYELHVPSIVTGLTSIATSLDKLANPPVEIVVPDGHFSLWEVDKVPCFSTAHMTVDDDDQFTRWAAAQEHLVATYHFGYVVWTGGEDYEDNRTFFEEKLSSAVCHLLETCAAQGANYVRFDGDGPKHSEFTIHDW